MLYLTLRLSLFVAFCVPRTTFTFIFSVTMLILRLYRMVMMVMTMETEV